MTDLYSLTEENLEKSIETLTVAEQPVPIKKGRGRPRKHPIPIDVVSIKETTINPDIINIKFEEYEFGKWKNIKVDENTPILQKWVLDCQKIVDDHFGENIWKLNMKAQKGYIGIYMNSDIQRIYAFVSKTTGNIHCPALIDEPFDDFVGNINDEKTRLLEIGPYGVISEWTWLPTHPDYKKYK